MKDTFGYALSHHVSRGGAGLPPASAEWILPGIDIDETLLSVV